MLPKLAAYPHRGGVAALFAIVASAACGEDDVLARAKDAFGITIGQESIGLYSESLVRGFNLQDAGNYRIGDTYYVRVAPLSDSVLAGTTIRVGPNALGFDYPAPSGVVQYTLLDDAHEYRRSIVGLADAASFDNPRPYARHYFSTGASAAWTSLSGGAVVYPKERYADGARGEYYSLGLIPRWRPAPGVEVTGLLHGAHWDTQGIAGYLPAGDGPLPTVRRKRFRGQPWTRNLTRDHNLGLILEAQPNPDWELRASTVLSHSRQPEQGFNLLYGIETDGTGLGRSFISRGRWSEARAAELRLKRLWQGPGRRSALDFVWRERRSSYRNPETTTVDVGTLSVLEPAPRRPRPALEAALAFDRGRIHRREFGISAQRTWASGLGLSGGLRRVESAESLRPFGAPGGRLADDEWLYNVSAVVPLGQRLAGFAAYTRGVEEAGVAPQNADNRFEVLVPVVSSQMELGIKWQLDADVALIATAFDLRKPNPGLGQDNVYRYIANVRHRGVEISLAGELFDRFQVVTGAMWMRPTLQGETVDQGLIGDRPVGRSDRLGLFSISYQVPGSAWSLDASTQYQGPRPADAVNAARTPGYSIINLGGRYRFETGRMPAQLRLRVLNATDTFAWVAGPSGIQSFNMPRRVDLSLTVGN